ncbi:T9SS type A sorting domain-containing protein [bacterium]|nr:T9SS type A sorting domain-containing protein [bacterium]
MQTVRYRTVLASLFILALILPISAFAYSTPGTGVVWSVEDLAADAGDVITWNDVAERWTATDTIFIAATDSVYIFDNFYVQASSDEGYDIHVRGSLLIGDPEGEPTDSVFIVGEDLSRGDGAGGVYAQDGGRLYLNRVVIEGHGADAIDDGVRVLDGTLRMDGCRVTNWAGYGARLSGADAVILNTLFHDNHEYTLSANSGTTLEIRGSSLVRNNLATPGSGKTALSVGTQGENFAIIDSCYLSGVPDNRSGGISVWNFTGTSQSAVITNTTVENCAFGIVVQSDGAYAEITNCQLINNTAYNVPNAAGSGISVYGGEAHASHNVISGNLWGITVPAGETSVLVLGVEDAENDYDEGYNRIFDNGNGGTTWALYNNVSVDISAQNNYWGTTDLAEVAEVIYDESDDASKGLVTYEPIWDGEGGGDNQPPVIDSYDPDLATVDVIRFYPYTFSVTASDPDGNDETLSYAWYDPTQGPEQPVGTESSITLSFGHDNTTETTLRVVVFDTEGDSVDHTWGITVQSPAWPEITDWSPEEDTVRVVEGSEVNFSITATLEGEPAELLYSWELDGEELAGEDTNELNYTFNAEGTYIVNTTAWYETPGETPWDDHAWTVIVSTNSAGEEPTLPIAYSVSTYPNPFNAEMSVRYALPTASQVQIAVYDLLGRQVAQFTPGLVQPGTHSWSFNARELPSGLYFLKVDAGQWHDIRKVTLLK